MCISSRFELDAAKTAPAALFFPAEVKVKRSRNLTEGMVKNFYPLRTIQSRYVLCNMARFRGEGSNA